MMFKLTIYPLLLALCTLSLFTYSTAAFCYDYQGLTLTSRPDIVPCNSIQGTVSMCCKTNTTDSPDTCLPNGLCRQSGNTPYYWRNDCSDPNWPGGSCIKACTGNSSVSYEFLVSLDFVKSELWTGRSCTRLEAIPLRRLSSVRPLCETELQISCRQDSGMAIRYLRVRAMLTQSQPQALDISGNIRMTPCDGTPTSGTWCCGTSTSCCGTSDAIALAATLGSQTTSSSATSSATPTSSPSPTSSASQTTTSAAATSSATSTGTASGLSGGAKAGIGIGAAAAGALLVLGGMFLLWRRHGKNAGTNKSGGPAHELPPSLPAYSDHPAGAYANGGDRWKFWQKSGQGNDEYGSGNGYGRESQMVQRQELDAMPRRQELQ